MDHPIEIDGVEIEIAVAHRRSTRYRQEVLEDEPKKEDFFDQKYSIATLPFGKVVRTRRLVIYDGPSIFIPMSAYPYKFINNHRQDIPHRGGYPEYRFVSKRVSEEIDGVFVEGMRVWRLDVDAAFKSKLRISPRRIRAPEKYPISSLPLSVIDVSGVWVGPSIFIPKEDKPTPLIMNAKTRIPVIRGRPAYKFVVRKDVVDRDGQTVSGKRVWRIPIDTV